MKKIKLSNLLPYLLSIITIYIFCIAFFGKEIFDNKTLSQTDTIKFQGMAKRTVDYKKRTGENILWNDAMFGGMPDYLITMGIPLGPVRWIRNTLAGFISLDTSMHLLFTFAICFWILLLTYKINPYLSLVGALAFAFSTYFIVITEVGHATKAWAIAYGALILGGIHLVFRGKYLLGLGLTTMALALEVHANHLQITFYLVFICLIYVINQLYFAVQSKSLPFFFTKAGILALAIFLAILTSIIRIWTIQEYTKYSIRGERILTSLEGDIKHPKSGLDRDYAFAWSQGKLETFTLLIPNFYGGSSTAKLSKDSQTYQFLENNLQGATQALRNNRISQREYAQRRNQIEQFKQYAPLYWGDQAFTAGPIYAGAVVCFLFMLAMLILDKQQRWWILSGVLLSIILAWGKNFSLFNYFLFDYVPGFNKFRSVSMALSMGLILIPLAAILALNKIIELKRIENFDKKLLIAASITGGLCLLMWLTASAGFFDFRGIRDGEGILFEMISSDRKNLFQSDALRSLFLIIFSFILIWLFTRKKISASILILGIALLMVGDLWQVAKRYIYDDKFQSKKIKTEKRASPADMQILKDSTLSYRVFSLNNPFNDSYISYFHRSVGGYHAAKMRRYQDLIERKITPEFEILIGKLRSGSPDFTFTPVLNMLNTKYIKFSEQADGIIFNSLALGNAWFVEKVLIASDADEEMNLLGKDNPKITAVIDSSRMFISDRNFILDSSANIHLIQYYPHRLTYESNNINKGLAVFSEIYYPAGWKAFIDGKETEIKCVNYVLRALEIPRGKHTIEFKFEPKSYTHSFKITTIGNYLVFIVFLVGICYEGYHSFFRKS